MLLGVFRWPLHAIVAAAAIATVAFAVGGCSTKNVAVQTPAPIPLPMPHIAPAAWDQRGTIVTQGPLDVQPEITAQLGHGLHAMYRSTSGVTGAATEVSGAFFIPKGNPPAGGWPVISFAHGATGLTTDCAPTTQPDLRGFGLSVASLLSGGTAVAFTDYEGLGGPGQHPFLEPRTAAFNVIDAVRALRALFPDVSARWVAFGTSQGGQASWAADEMNKFYGDGLDLLGSVAMAPAANISGLAQRAFAGTLTPEQLGIMPAVVVGVQRTYPAAAMDHLIRGASAQQVDKLIGCGPNVNQLRASVLPADVKPASETDEFALADSLRKMALPVEKLSAPMLVVNGLNDELILPQWVSASVARACDIGGQISHRELAGVAHSFAPDADTMTWVADRFAGKSAPSDCPENKS